jgi:hypothetical protein
MTVSPQSASPAPEAQADEESLYQGTMQAPDAPETGSALGKAVLLAGSRALVMLGKPVIEGTRITVELILTRLAEGRAENP